VCLSVRTITFGLPRYMHLACWFTLILYRSNSKVKIIGQVQGHRRKMLLKWSVRPRVSCDCGAASSVSRSDGAAVYVATLLCAVALVIVVVVVAFAVLRRHRSCLRGTTCRSAFDYLQCHLTDDQQTNRTRARCVQFTVFNAVTNKTALGHSATEIGTVMFMRRKCVTYSYRK